VPVFEYFIDEWLMVTKDLDGMDSKKLVAFFASFSTFSRLLYEL